MCNFQQSVKESTRKENILDIFLTNRPSLVNKCTTIPGLGDHEAVLTDTNTKANRVKPIKRKIMLWNRMDSHALKASAVILRDTFMEKFTTTSSVEDMWSFIKSSLGKMIENLVPTKMSTTRYNQPWINTEIKRLSRQKHRRYIKAKGKPKASKEYRRYIGIKRKCEQKCREAHSKFMSDLISPENDKNNKKFWSYIKSNRKDNTGVAPLQNENGILFTDSSSKANILNDQFSNVFNKNEDKSSIPNKGPSLHPNMSNITITENGVKKLLNNLNPHKATGPDDVPARLLKEIAEEIAPVFTNLFQASLNQGKIPRNWKTANVIPAFKKGNKAKPENYRPISLTCITCKIMEHIISSNLMTHLERNHILTDAQFGFRKNRSCETQLINTVQNLAKLLDNRSQIDTVLLDFSKAFDKVPHHRLRYKLEYYGVSGSTLNWIVDFLYERTQKVVLEGSCSGTASVDSGVPQGSVLAPVLFLIDINDLPDYITNGSSTNLFADDSILYREIKSPQDAQLLQNDLENLMRWESDWLMEFHPQKCQILNITNKRTPIKYQYSIHGHNLETVDSAKYLGVHIHRQLNWNTHIDKIVSKANQTRSFIQRNLRKCPESTKELAYKAMVRPVLEYASTVWDPHTQENIKKVEMVQRRAARFVKNQYGQTSSVTEMLHHLQWQSLRERRAQAKVTMFYKITHNVVSLTAPVVIQPIVIRGYSHRYLIPFARTLTYQRSFFPDTLRLWNSLPPTIAACPNVETFNQQVQSLLLR